MIKLDDRESIINIIDFLKNRVIGTEKVYKHIICAFKDYLLHIYHATLDTEENVLNKNRIEDNFLQLNKNTKFQIKKHGVVGKSNLGRCLCLLGETSTWGRVLDSN